MTQTSPPFDDRHLFADPLEAARTIQGEAERLWRAGRDLEADRLELRARDLRRMAARGERLPEF